MISIRLLSCAALICFGSIASAAEFTGKVIAVMDGDTLLILRDGHPAKVRLAGIDAPEKTQPFGAASQKSLAEIVMGKQIRVVSRAVDDYGRLVATAHAGEINVNHEQVRRGMAWEYSRHHSNRKLVALQRDAQQARRGLWAEEGAIEPSQWRKQHPLTFAAGATATHEAVHGKPQADPVLQPSPGQACARKNCAQMASCEEARDYLNRCGAKLLDGNRDGVPCEKLCAANKVSLTEQ
ncbi:MAG: thermonuclease family protein [Gallionella sp.]|nr:thermonuclease family protein [Gallionella sp.]